MRPVINRRPVSKQLIILNILVALIYIGWWFMWKNRDNPILYSLLFLGEIYHVGMALTFWYTLWPSRNKNSKALLDLNKNESFAPWVDIFITVAGEEVEVVSETAIACKNIHYPNHKVYILNDGYVAKKDNWKEIEQMAENLGVNCITRKEGKGAKAGNINNALSQTNGEIVAIFDADMVPYEDFLEKTIPYFKNEKTGFVQTPQYYKNHFLNGITGAAWEQQELFFGPIMSGKERNNASFICGTNVAIRRRALEEVGGMNDKNIAEDFLTSLSIHQKGWKSYYITEVLAQGLAPQDLLSYCKQQLRWARGSLEVLFGYNPILKKGLRFGQKIEYISSALFHMNGLIVLIDMVMPLLFLFFDLQPVSETTTNFAIFFVPFIFSSLYTLYLASGSSFTFRAISFSHSLWPYQLRALKGVLLNQPMAFSVTPKRAQKGRFIFLAYPHLLYVGLTIAASIVGIYREGINSSIATNVSWAAFNVILFIPFIRASLK